MSAFLTTPATVSLVNTASFAICGLQPDLQRLYAFAGITGTAAKRDVLSGDYASIIHDVFPARTVLYTKHDADFVDLFRQCSALVGTAPTTLWVNHCHKDRSPSSLPNAPGS
jgi:hypothetical protein